MLDEIKPTPTCFLYYISHMHHAFQSHALLTTTEYCVVHPSRSLSKMQDYKNPCLSLRFTSKSYPVSKPTPHQSERRIMACKVDEDMSYLFQITRIRGVYTGDGIHEKTALEVSACLVRKGVRKDMAGCPDKHQCKNKWKQIKQVG